MWIKLIKKCTGFKKLEEKGFTTKHILSFAEDTSWKKIPQFAKPNEQPPGLQSLPHVLSLR